MILVYISLLIVLLYVVLIGSFTIGWSRIKVFKPTISTNFTSFKITVIVAFRNEEQHLQQLINALKQQTFADFELILVNDHSSDASVSIVEACIADFNNLKLLHAKGFGKKNALKEAVLQAKSEFILTTDADCIPENTWIETISNFQSEFPSDLLVCPVRLNDNNHSTVFSRLQQHEFASLVASGAGAVGIGKPILCNGANLAFTKKAWLESQSDLHSEIISGDDVFLLLSIKKRKGIIRFVKSKQAFVNTTAVATLKGFVKQRQRWASKSSAYTDRDIILTAIVVFGVSLVQFCLLLLSFFAIKFLFTLIIVTFNKFIVDFVFLNKIKMLFLPTFSVKYVFLLSIIYPVYTVYVAISSFFSSKSKW